MNQNKTNAFKIIAVTLFIAAIVGFSSCEKYVWAPPIWEPVDTTGVFDTVYYDSDIAPLFPDKGCTGCHFTGGRAPDLTASNSYNALTSVPGQYVNPGAPQESRLLTIQGSTSHSFALSEANRKLVFDWISQGAKNYTKQ